MSNWSVVIVTWSGVDRTAASGETRWQEILRGYAAVTGGPEPRSPKFFDSMSLGLACECVGLFGENHFDPADLLDVLREMGWTYPDQVEVIWKSEDLGQFQVERLVPREP